MGLPSGHVRQRAHWGLAMTLMIIGLASIMGPVPANFNLVLQCSDRDGHGAAEVQPAVRGQRGVPLPGGHSLQVHHELPELPVIRPGIPDSGRDRTIVLTFCYSSASDLEWNQGLLKQ